MPFRLAGLVSVIILTIASAGCAAEDPAAVVESGSGERSLETMSSSLTPFVGTWRWSGSGQRLGFIELGEEHFVFRSDGTYAVVSKSGDGESECYEGTFTWRSDAGQIDRGTMIFRSSRVSAAEGYEREVYLDDADSLHFGSGGVYRRTAAVIDTRCP